MLDIDRFICGDFYFAFILHVAQNLVYVVKFKPHLVKVSTFSRYTNLAFFSNNNNNNNNKKLSFVPDLTLALDDLNIIKALT